MWRRLLASDLRPLITTSGHKVVGLVAVGFADDISPAGEMVEGGFGMGMDVGIPDPGLFRR